MTNSNLEDVFPEEKNSIDTPQDIQEPELEPKTEPQTEPQAKPKTEPQILIKKEKYTIFHMLRNVLIIAIVLIALYFISPFEVVTVSSSSMQPTLPVGSVSIAVKADEDTKYEVGDIITFAVEYNGTYYSRVTHRIVAINEDGTIQTKGDNNPENDPFTIKKSQIRNVVKWINIFKH